jgi:4-amino-4-deoxy-L-arabinose transferase-like glycosyltransferase
VIDHRPEARQHARRGFRAGRIRLEPLAIATILLVATVVMLATSPVNDDFWWQDAPRHALNGSFVKDFVKYLPWRDPVSWAENYYIRYPSLTILFYPPLFYAVEAVFFALLGVSHFAAQCAVSPFVLLLGIAAYCLARLYVPRWSALGVALLILGAPETALWGRQVMLDIPMQATLTAGVVVFVEFLRNRQYTWLYSAVALLVASLYIKLTAVFILPPLLLALFMAQGWAVLRDRRLILTAILSVVAAIPAVLLTLRFGAVNLENVAGSAAVGLSLADPRAWVFYARAIPAQIGIVPAVLAPVGAAALLMRHDVTPAVGDDIGANGTAPSRPVWLSTLMLTWFAFGYLFFSAIAVREPRHDLSILLPVVVCAALALHRFLPSRIAQASMLALGLLTMAYSLTFFPVPTVRGYREIADYVAANLPHNGIVVYSGYRDANFVFAMRTHAERDDVTILRADKLLLRMAVTRDWGVQQTNLDTQEIAAMLRKYGVTMIVAQRGFWDDLRQMNRFNQVIQSSDFREIAHFEVSGNLSSNDGDATRGTIQIFKPTYTVTPPQGSIEIDMPFIGSRIHGTAEGRSSAK